MADQDDDLGDDTGGDTGAENSKPKEKETKPNKAKNGGGEKGKKDVGAAEGGNTSQSSNAPTPAASAAEHVSKDTDTPRAKALQAKAREKATEMKRRVGQTIKCPHCEQQLHVEKTHPEKGLRDLICKNPACSRLDTRPTPYRRQVSLSRALVNEDDEDFGVMSARQRAHAANQES